jgi:hypothetical protein
MRYLEYNASAAVPNVVVDGSPNDSTVLTLTHWPGIAQPAGLQADLSAEMAFLFNHRGERAPADVVTNNHFDQDGLVAMFALVYPDAARRHEELLIDIAAAGDFGTYRLRDAARASMTIAAYADASRSPIAAELTGPYDEQCEVLYRTLLELLPDLVTDIGRFEPLWADEDDDLTAGEIALANGTITVQEFADVDLAVVDIDPAERSRSGHRFGHDSYHGAHPMALNNATSCFRLLQVHGRRYSYTDRYESWVQYRTRRPLPRVDLRPLAEELGAADSGTEWLSSAPSALSPQLRTTGDSSLDRRTVLERLRKHLTDAPPAWDPYVVTP